MSVRSARSPSTRLSAPRMMDLPAPVSPVMTLQPGCNSSVRSLTRARFLMRNVVNMVRFVPAEFDGYAAVRQKENAQTNLDSGRQRFNILKNKPEGNDMDGGLLIFFWIIVGALVGG